MKRVFCIALIALGLLAFSGCTGDYTRTATVCIDSEGDQVLWDSYGELWMVREDFPVGAEVEITLRDGGILNAVEDDVIVNVEVIRLPVNETAEIETVIEPLLGY